MDSTLIKNGRLIDPSSGLDVVRDLWIVDGVIAETDQHGDADKVIDATGKIVMPGLVDIHVHLREPGNENAETIATGSAAAIAGGFTSICCMPNTSPALDTPERVRKTLARAKLTRGARVYVVAAITRGRTGWQLTDMPALARAGVVGFSDDGNGVQDDAIARRAMEQTALLDLPFIEHCQLATPAEPGPTSESAMVERDIALAEETGARLHLQHISAARSVQLIRRAKERGLHVTAEVTPHHLTLTEEDVGEGDPNFKMNPPLRTAEDRAALQEAIRDGAIDCIATDHAPHDMAAKSGRFGKAAFGVIGMETALAVIWTELVKTGLLSPADVVERMSTAPARVARLPAGTLSPGARGDVTVFDPNAEWTVNPDEFRSLSRNCPFAGWRVTGRVMATIIGGEALYGDNLH